MSAVVSARIFNKASTTGRMVQCRATKAPAPRNAKVVNNRALNGKLPAQQFDVRVGKDQVSRVTLGFTKSNELFVGRVAMLGFAAAVLGELATGRGALAQFGLETGLPLTDIDGIVAAIAIFNLVAAFLPAKGTLVLDEDEAQDNRKKGVLQDPKINVLQPKKFFGFSGFGFTKDNEIFVGRMAQLGFAAALIGESVTGKGPLAQIGLETGIPFNEVPPLLALSIAFTLFAAINEGTGRYVDEK